MSVRTDIHSAIHLRTPPESVLQSFRKNKDFQYGTAQSHEPGLIKRFFDWIGNLLHKLFEGKHWKISFSLFYIGIILLLLYFFLKLMKNKPEKLFYSSGSPNNSFSPISRQEFQNIDFDAQIDEAVQKFQYRIAIRLLYLKTLQTLASKNLIIWRVDKTDEDYVKELQKTPFDLSFRKVTGLFEYAWYGNFPLSEEIFRDLSHSFQDFHSKLTEVRK